jgi:hypothetical protein
MLEHGSTRLVGGKVSGTLETQAAVGDQCVHTCQTLWTRETELPAQRSCCQRYYCQSVGVSLSRGNTGHCCSFYVLFISIY